MFTVTPHPPEDQTGEKEKGSLFSLKRITPFLPFSCVILAGMLRESECPRYGLPSAFHRSLRQKNIARRLDPADDHGRAIAAMNLTQTSVGPRAFDRLSSA
jgi:hypothetical protein